MLKDSTLLKTCFGIDSLCDDGKHVLFLDYDNVELCDIVQEIEKMQLVFNLSNFYIISTLNGYNAFCLDKLPFTDLSVIYDTSKLICSDFVKYSLKRGRFTLGMSGYKQIVYVSESNNKFYTKSNAHKMFFNDIMNFNITDNINFDNGKSLVITAYKSEKHGVNGVNLNERKKKE